MYEGNKIEVLNIINKKECILKLNFMRWLVATLKFSIPLKILKLVFMQMF